MREIIFKAKTKVIAGYDYNNGKEDGEWVKGYLYNDIGCWKIKQFEFDRADYVDYEVDPETVCQYTGMTDINDAKIFEYDIIQMDGYYYFVKYNNNTASFVICNIDSNLEETNFIDWYHGAVEVVGNIFNDIKYTNVNYHTP